MPGEMKRDGIAAGRRGDDRRRRCPVCHQTVRGNIRRHIRIAHCSGGNAIVARQARRNRTALAATATLITVVIVVSMYLLLHRAPNDGGPDEPAYKPSHPTGNGLENYWTVYPSSHVLAGGSVPIPAWAKDEAASRVLLILVHSEGCAPCIQQGADIARIMNDTRFSSTVNSLDMLSTGTDQRAQDCFNILDPEGSANYIPLTIVMVRTPDGAYLWHSWEGVTGKANLEGWLSDALHYQTAGVG
jgi:hypothetical protein